ncbi:MAG: DUF3035 domain-containing protein [Boseongicola sp. SB0677_bin_26]|nr:DUF3035 domain-containing protein [Boseongicola sp. SB0665_bin_10]MYG24682.1 DUF3035 domain-containing protein [Boseongicola sp. SB0677_bin_26]
MLRRLLLLCLVPTLGACAGGDPGLMNIGRDRAGGPDEFGVIPTRPLEVPEDISALPVPTPGGANLADPAPERDVASALGGDIGALARGSTDGALLAHATRHGVDSDIRVELAAADLEFRRDNPGRVLERLFDVNVYFRAYQEMALDQHAELARLRRLGIRTSAAPPGPVEE